MIKKLICAIGLSFLGLAQVNAQMGYEGLATQKQELIQRFIAEQGYENLYRFYQQGQVDFQRQYGYFPNVAFEDFVWQVLMAQSGVDVNALNQQNLAMHQQYLAQNQASFEATQAAYRGLQASYDDWNQSWNQTQATLGQINTDYTNAAINDQWSVYDPNTGEVMMMPLYPVYSSQYTDSAGNPLVFDQTMNAWYQVDPFGNRTQLPWTPSSTGF